MESVFTLDTVLLTGIMGASYDGSDTGREPTLKVHGKRSKRCMGEYRISRRKLLKVLVAGGLSSCHPALAEFHMTSHGGRDAWRDDRSGPVSVAVILEGPRFHLLQQTVQRLQRLQNSIGYAHFNLLSFDQARRHAHHHASVGAFPAVELDFLEEIFFADATRYGFFGAKVFTELTATIPKRDTYKVPGSGHYLFKGKPLEVYREVQREIGDTVILTSGIRGVIKQIHLFLAKAVATEGNLSLASHSLAPPGHSYHGIGDFDIGRRGLGRRNFTEEFAKTDEFKRLTELGHVTIRYPQGNPYGVRYEPWHIGVV